MCCMERDQLAAGAWIRETNTGNVYCVLDVKQGMATVVLEDVLSPLTSERMQDPDVPGRLGASMILEPSIIKPGIEWVRNHCDLVMHAPDPRDIASEEEFGPLSTA